MQVAIRKLRIFLLLLFGVLVPLFPSVISHAHADATNGKESGVVYDFSNGANGWDGFNAGWFNHNKEKAPDNTYWETAYLVISKEPIPVSGENAYRIPTSGYKNHLFEYNSTPYKARTIDVNDGDGTHDYECSDSGYVDSVILIPGDQVQSLMRDLGVNPDANGYFTVYSNPVIRIRNSVGDELAMCYSLADWESKKWGWSDSSSFQYQYNKPLVFNFKPDCNIKVNYQTLNDGDKYSANSEIDFIGKYIAPSDAFHSGATLNYSDFGLQAVIKDGNVKIGTTANGKPIYYEKDWVLTGVKIVNKNGDGEENIIFSSLNVGENNSISANTVYSLVNNNHNLGVSNITASTGEFAIPFQTMTFTAASGYINDIHTQTNGTTEITYYYSEIVEHHVLNLRSYYIGLNEERASGTLAVKGSSATEFTSDKLLPITKTYKNNYWELIGARLGKKNTDYVLQIGSTGNNNDGKIPNSVWTQQWRVGIEKPSSPTKEALTYDKDSGLDIAPVLTKEQNAISANFEEDSVYAGIYALRPPQVEVFLYRYYDENGDVQHKLIDVESKGDDLGGYNFSKAKRNVWLGDGKSSAESTTTSFIEHNGKQLALVERDVRTYVGNKITKGYNVDFWNEDNGWLKGSYRSINLYDKDNQDTFPSKKDGIPDQAAINAYYKDKTNPEVISTVTVRKNPLVFIWIYEEIPELTVRSYYQKEGEQKFNSFSSGYVTIPYPPGTISVRYDDVYGLDEVDSDKDGTVVVEGVEYYLNKYAYSGNSDTEKLLTFAVKGGNFPQGAIWHEAYVQKLGIPFVKNKAVLVKLFTRNKKGYWTTVYLNTETSTTGEKAVDDVNSVYERQGIPSFHSLINDENASINGEYNDSDFNGQFGNATSPAWILTNLLTSTYSLQQDASEETKEKAAPKTIVGFENNTSVESAATTTGAIRDSYTLPKPADLNKWKNVKILAYEQTQVDTSKPYHDTPSLWFHGIYRAEKKISVYTYLEDVDENGVGSLRLYSSLSTPLNIYTKKTSYSYKPYLQVGEVNGQPIIYRLKWVSYDILANDFMENDKTVAWKSDTFREDLHQKVYEIFGVDGKKEDVLYEEDINSPEYGSIKGFVERIFYTKDKGEQKVITQSNSLINVPVYQHGTHLVGVYERIIPPIIPPPTNTPPGGGGGTTNDEVLYYYQTPEGTGVASNSWEVPDGIETPVSSVGRIETDIAYGDPIDKEGFAYDAEKSIPTTEYLGTSAKGLKYYADLEYVKRSYYYKFYTILSKYLNSSTTTYDEYGNSLTIYRGRCLTFQHTMERFASHFFLKGANIYQPHSSTIWNSTISVKDSPEQGAVIMFGSDHPTKEQVRIEITKKAQVSIPVHTPEELSYCYGVEDIEEEDVLTTQTSWNDAKNEHIELAESLVDPILVANQGVRFYNGELDFDNQPIFVDLLKNEGLEEVVAEPILTPVAESVEDYLFSSKNNNEYPIGDWTQPSTICMQIPAVLENKQWDSKGAMHYTCVFSYGEGASYPERDYNGESTKTGIVLGMNVNPVIIHTPVFVNFSLEDLSRFDQRIRPGIGTPLILDKSFALKVNSVGYHKGLPGYGTRDYSKYLSKEYGVRVRFSFPVIFKKKDGGESYAPNNTWISVEPNSEQVFFLPSWANEGDAQLAYVRAEAINARWDGTMNYVLNPELEANRNPVHYAAFDQELVSVVGRVYGLQIIDVGDYPLWEDYFRKRDGSLSGKAYKSGIYDQNGFRNGNKYKYTFPMIPGSHPTIANEGILKPGYTIRYKLQTVGNMFSLDDYVRIVPSFYHIDKKTGQRTKVDVYYGETFGGKRYDFVRVGSNEDLTNKKYLSFNNGDFGVDASVLKNTASLLGYDSMDDFTGRESAVYTFGYTMMNQFVRTFVGKEHNSVVQWRNGTPGSVNWWQKGMSEYEKVESGIGDRIAISVQDWYSQYYLPSDLFVTDKAESEVRNAIKTGGNPWLDGGYLLIHFDITTLNEKELHLAYDVTTLREDGNGCNMWSVEGYATNKKGYNDSHFNFEYGDFVLLDLGDGDGGNGNGGSGKGDSAKTDYGSGGTH